MVRRNSVQDLAKLVWAVGGVALVRRIVLLASRMKDSFEEAATKILVVFFSHRDIQDAVRAVGVPLFTFAASRPRFCTTSLLAARPRSAVQVIL
jgi:hypothetical protein